MSYSDYLALQREWDIACRDRDEARGWLRAMLAAIQPLRDGRRDGGTMGRISEAADAAEDFLNENGSDAA